MRLRHNQEVYKQMSTVSKDMRLAKALMLLFKDDQLRKTLDRLYSMKSNDNNNIKITFDQISMIVDRDEIYNMVTKILHEREFIKTKYQRQ